MPYIPQVKVGNTEYFLKDSEARKDISTIKHVLSDNYEYFDIDIPAGQSGNMDVSISNKFDLDYSQVIMYYTADDGVYNGDIRLDAAGYSDTKYLSNKNQNTECPFIPYWIRLYENNMTKSEGSVVGGTVRIYFKYIVSMKDDAARKEIELIDNRLSDIFNYFEIDIPAGTTANIDTNIAGNFDSDFSKVVLYYEADDGVYNGNLRLDAVSYSDTIYVDTKEKKVICQFSPVWLRLYVDNMVKVNGSVVGGKIRIYYHYPVSLVEPFINGKTFESYFRNYENYMPDYYEEHMQMKLSQIRDNMMEVGKNGETFIFITDVHWESNTGNSPYLINYLLKNLNINVMLCGGDLINQGEKEPMIEMMRKAITSFSPWNNIVMPCAFGNHDSNWNDWAGQREHPERKLDSAAQYALMQKQSENLVTYISNNHWNFYFDVEQTKTRYIIIDTGEDGTFSEYDDLIRCLNDTPSNYHIIIMGHWFYNSGAISSSCETIMELIDAYNHRDSGSVEGTITYDFTKADSTIVLLLGGHMHNDMTWSTTNGVPVVLTDCDAGSRSSNVEYPFVAGTITEQAFDVFTLNYNTGVIKTVRIGRGANRVWGAD